MLGRLVNDYLKKAPPSYPWGDTLPALRRSDLRICNLECVISDKGAPFGSKAFYFRSGAKNISVLKAADINLVSLANNHSLDFGYAAMEEMLGILDRNNIGRAGAGANIKEASRPAFIDRGGKRVGFLSFTDNEPDWEAGADTPGVFYAPIDMQDKRTDELLKTVREARRKVNLLIVSAHWGPNWGYRPLKEHKAFAHALVDAGADIVFGHSPHVFRGIEFYRRRPIIYSAGDFVDDYAVDESEKNDESFIFMCDLMEGKKTVFRLYPTVIDDFQARLAALPRAEAIAGKMHLLCRESGSSALWREEGYLEVSEGKHE